MSLAASRMAALLETMKRSNPFCANCLASSKPIPLEAPVTKARGLEEVLMCRLNRKATGLRIHFATIPL